MCVRFFAILGRLKAIADLLLIFVMVGALYTHYAQHDPMEKMLPAVVAGFLVFVRHLLFDLYGHVDVVEVKPSSKASREATKKTN